MKTAIVFLVMLFIGTVWGTSAASAIDAPSWSVDSPTVVRDTPRTYPTNPECPTYEREARVVGQGAPKGMCIFGDDSLTIGYYSDGGPYVGAVSFAYSEEFHVLEGVCGGSWRCRYSAANDTLVTMQQISQFGTGLVLYRQVKERIDRISGPSGDRFIFDTTNPDFALKNDQGRYVWTPSYAMSQNGKWVSAELRDKGVALVNTETLEVRQVSTTGYLYGYGRDLTVRLAVANDGSAVLVTGMNAGMSIIDTVQACGQPLIGELRLQPGVADCPIVDLLGYASFPNFSFADLPRFIGDGTMAEMVVHSWVDGARRVAFLAHGARASHQLQFLSIGDSFSSGEGETDSKFYLPGTNDGFDSCHLSSRAYPLLVAARAGIGASDVRSVACAGARIKDIIGPGDYWGQSGRLGVAGLNMSVKDKASAQAKALEEFQPGRALQSDFLDRYNPEVIMLGVGGNDAGLMGKVRACAMPGTCKWAVGPGKQATAKEIERLSTSLTDLLSFIAKQNPSSRVYVAGYPIGISSASLCDPVTGFLFDETEREYFSQSITYVNQVIRQTVAKTAFTYMDIERSLAGHELCSGASSQVMNGLQIGGDIAPISGLPSIKLISAGSFHPNPTGHQLIAEAVTRDYPSLSAPGAQDGCIDPTVCDVRPHSTQLPQYWADGTGPIAPEAYLTDFATMTADPMELEVSVPAGSLMPDSAVRIELHSEPMLLKELVTDAEGQLSTTITLPDSILDGVHTLHLFGTNREGREVDLYQFCEKGLGLGSTTTSTTADFAAAGTPYDAAPPRTDRPSIPSPIPAATSQAVLGTAVIASPSAVDDAPVAATARQGSPSASWLWATLVASVVLIACIVLVLSFKRWAKPST